MQKLEGKWLVAVSAGSDSMALLNMCIECDMDVVAAHVNYHHRKEADIEEKYVRSFCQKHQIPLCVRNEPFVWNGNFEASARDWRYSFFVQCVKEYGLSGVLVAHHEDDLIETYLMQEEKGVEPAYYGLKEDMMYEGVLVKRPLLHETKKQLVSYCKEKGITYYEDCTNADESLTRNRIRHRVVEKLTRFERNMILHEIAMKNAEKQERICRVTTYVQQKRVSLHVYRCLEIEDRLALLRIFLKQEIPKASRAHLCEIDHCIMQQKDFVIPCLIHDLVSDGKIMFLFPKQKPYCDVFSSLEEMKEHSGTFYKIEKGSLGTHALTLSASDFPLQIRNARSGDAIQMRFGTKKVHRFFIDRHIPLYQRQFWPVVENAQGNVIFVAGLGCDKYHYTVNPSLNVVEYTLLKE